MAVNAVILRIDKEKVLVKIDNIYGEIPITEFHDIPKMKIGDIVEVMVECGKNGQWLISHKKTSDMIDTGWDLFEKDMDFDDYSLYKEMLEEQQEYLSEVNENELPEPDKSKMIFTYGDLEPCPHCGSNYIRTFTDGTSQCESCHKWYRYA